MTSDSRFCTSCLSDSLQNLLTIADQLPPLLHSLLPACRLASLLAWVCQMVLSSILSPPGFHQLNSLVNRLMQPLRSMAITATSSLLRVAPPQFLASVLSPSWFQPF